MKTAVLILFSLLSSFETILCQSGDPDSRTVQNIFVEGLEQYVAGKSDLAIIKFDAAVDTILRIRTQTRQPSGCYDQLIENIYRIEFPSKQSLPDFASLSEICSWTIDNKLTSAALMKVGLGESIRKVVSGTELSAPLTTSSSDNPSTPIWSSTSELDTRLTSLPKNFRGHNFQAIYTSVSKLNLQKSEFEKAAEYEERLNGLRQRVILGNIRFSSILGFIYQPIGILKYASANYDADASRLSISIRPASYYRTGGATYDSIPIGKSEPRVLGTYIGSNAYGARARITRVEFDSFLVAFPRCKSKLFDVSLDETKFSLPMRALDAIDLKYNLGILVVGKLASPFKITERSLLVSPTISSRSEIWQNQKILFLEIESLWILSTASGRVYAKVPRCGEPES